jgi:hypothetical protein
LRGWYVHELLCPAKERWIALRKSVLPLMAMAVTMLLVFLYGCQADKQGEARSSENTAQGRTAEETGQVQGDLDEAQVELGPKVAKIMNHPFYRYGEWGLLEVDSSDGRTVRSLGPSERLYIPGSSISLPRAPSTPSTSTLRTSFPCRGRSP